MDVPVKDVYVTLILIAARRNGTISVSQAAPMIVGSVEMEAESALPTDAALPMVQDVAVVPVKIVCVDLIVSAATTRGTPCA